MTARPAASITETPRQRHVRLHRLILAAGRVPQTTLAGCELQARMLASGELPELPELPKPSAATLRAIEGDRRRQAEYTEDDLGEHHGWDTERAFEVDIATKAAWLEFMEPDGTPKKQTFIAVTKLTEVGLDQALVSHDELVEYLSSEHRLDVHQRADALRLLRARGMPISAGHDRARAPDEGCTFTDFTTNHPEET